MPTGAVFATLFLLAPFVVPWDHVLSPQAFFSVDPRVEYRDVKANPGKVAGRTLMLAGAIAENVTSGEGTTLEIVCYTRDAEDRPGELDEACGRFLARTGRFLDPEQYAQGRKVTLTGIVAGRTIRALRAGEHEFPLFEIGEIYVWPKPSPARHAHPCDPFWDPFYDPFHRHRWPYWW